MAMPDHEKTEWISTLRLQVAATLKIPMQVADQLLHAATLMELTDLHCATFIPEFHDRPAMMKLVTDRIYARLQAAA